MKIVDAPWFRKAMAMAGICLLASPIVAGANDDLEKLIANPNNWAMQAGDMYNQRYSKLSQINKSNVGKMQVAWMFSTGVLRGHEGSPLVMNGMMYLHTPFPNKVFAIDLDTQKIKWRYEPKQDAAVIPQMCCDTVNRGLAYAENKIFLQQADSTLVALDANTGKVLWSVKNGDPKVGAVNTNAPHVFKDKVITGISGGEWGVRGYLTAYDINTGKQVWRAYSTGPDNEMLIDPEKTMTWTDGALKPVGKDSSLKSWQGDQWKLGGGTTWGWYSYDKGLNLIYYGTGNPSTWNPAQRPGDNKWTSGIFARDADTGQARWFYQTSPHDMHDYDGINESILIDVAVGGQTHHALVHADRNGYVYVIDRASGQVLSATPFVPITTSLGVDVKDGRIAWNPDKSPEPGKTVRDICPASPGGKDWQPAAYSPRTHLVYIPHQNLCQDAMTSQVSYIAGTPYVGAELKMKPGPGGKRGLFTAWDPTAAKAAWKIDEDFPVWSGALATAGDLVFYGTMEGWFKAVDARTGKVLWQFKTGSGIIGQPIVYKGPDGHEYVAVLSGVGGWVGAIVDGDLSPQDPTGALGFVGAVPDLKQKTTPGGMLYVFALPH